MSRTYHHGKRHVYVKAKKRQEPDYKKMGQALIALARAQAEKEAKTAHVKQRRSPTTKAAGTEPKAEKGDAA